MSSNKIAVVGDRDSVLGFKALGLEVFPAQAGEEAKPILRQLAKEDYGIVYLTEQLALQLPEDEERYKDARNPAIINNTGQDGPPGLGMAQVKRCVERAVGADIL